MYTNITSRLSFFIFITFIFLLSGCAFHTERVTFKSSLIKEKPFPAKTSAQSTEETPKTLMAKGYFKLGTLTVDYDIQECESMERGKNCKEIAHKETSSQRLLNEAAERGGELVSFDKRDVPVATTDSRKGKCLQGHNKLEWVTVLVPVYEIECSMDSYGFQSCSKRSKGTKTELVQQNVFKCDLWEYIQYAKTTSRSIGDVWRHDPVYAKETKLLYTLEYGSEKELLTAIESSNDINSLLFDGELIIDKVFKRDDTNALKLLLQRHLDPNKAIYKEGQRPPLEIAMAYGAVHSFKMLLEHGAKPYDDLFRWAVFDKHPEFLKELLKYDKNKNGGATALCTLADSRLDDVTRREKFNMLMKLGVKLDAGDGKALQCAIEYGNMNFMKTLIAKGAPVHHLGFALDRIETYKKGIEHTNVAGTALYPDPSELVGIEPALLLSSLDINPNARNVNATPALSIFTIYGKMNGVKNLLRRGATVDLRNAAGQTALMYAAQYGQLMIAEMLLDKGANVNLADKNGNTALMWAAASLNTAMVQLLLSHGTDPGLYNTNNQTALDIVSNSTMGVGYTAPIVKLLSAYKTVRAPAQVPILHLPAAYDNNVQLLIQLPDNWSIISVNQHGSQLMNSKNFNISGRLTLGVLGKTGYYDQATADAKNIYQFFDNFKIWLKNAKLDAESIKPFHGLDVNNAKTYIMDIKPTGKELIVLQQSGNVIYMFEFVILKDFDDNYPKYKKDFESIINSTKVIQK